MALTLSCPGALLSKDCSAWKESPHEQMPLDPDQPCIVDTGVQRPGRAGLRRFPGTNRQQTRLYRVPRMSRQTRVANCRCAPPIAWQGVMPRLPNATWTSSSGCRPCGAPVVSGMRRLASTATRATSWATAYSWGRRKPSSIAAKPGGYRLFLSDYRPRHRGTLKPGPIRPVAAARAIRQGPLAAADVAEPEWRTRSATGQSTRRGR